MGQGSGYVDFKAVKESVTVPDVLTHYKLRDAFTEKSGALYGPCPVHKGTRGAQFKVDRDGRKWFCFGTCKMGGNVLDLVAKLERVNVSEAARRIAGWFGIAAPHEKPPGAPVPKPESPVRNAEAPVPKAEPTTPPVPPPPPGVAKSAAVPKAAPAPRATPPPPSPEVVIDTEPPAEWVSGTEEDRVNVPLTFALKALDPNLPAPGQSGFRFAPETLGHFGAGVFTGKGIMQGRLAVPVHNPTGELVAYIGRPLSSGSDLHPKGFNARRELYNLHRVLAEHQAEQELVIAPDIFDVWRLHEIGKHAAVALFGRLLSLHQVELLRKALAGRWAVLIAPGGSDQPAATNLAMIAELAFVRWVKLPRSAYQYEPDELARILSELS